MQNKNKNRASLVRSFLFLSLLSTLITLLFWGVLLLLAPEKDTETEWSPQKSVTVILDPGHGGEDGGAVGEGDVYEKHLNLTIAQEIEKHLKMNGISVVCTRNEDILLYDRNVDYKGRKKMLDLATRLKISRETENSIFVSIHMNSFPKTQYSGLQVYYSKNDSSSAELATLIQENTKKFIHPDNNRKIKQASTNIYLLDRITTPAVLVECGFLSNAGDLALLTDSDYRQKLSLVIADAIVRFLANGS